MTDRERHALLFGPYSTPAFHFGDVVFCEMRGEVTLVGLTGSRIPWPIGERGRSKTHAIIGDLADALRSESAAAVCYWWGVNTTDRDEVAAGARRWFAHEGDLGSAAEILL